MVAPEREPLKHEAEIDECWIGGMQPGIKGREAGDKTLVAVAIEVRGQGSGRLQPSTDGRLLGARSAGVRLRHGHARSDRAHRRMTQLQQDRPASAAQPARHPRPRRRGPDPATGASRDQQPEDLADRHPPRRLTRTPARLPRRVRLPPPPPPRHPDGRLPDAARSRRDPPATRSPAGPPDPNGRRRCGLALGGITRRVHIRLFVLGGTC